MTKTYAIILGAAVHPDATPSPTLRRRAERGAALYLSGAVDGIVATGGPQSGPVSEAAVTIDLLTGLGVPGAAILRDDRSRSTRENIANAIALLPEGTKLILVSDGWHLPRARLIARRLGPRVQSVATSRDGTSLRGTAKHILREALALAWEVLRPAQRG